MKKFFLDRAHFIAELLISVIIIGLLLHFAGFEEFLGYMERINWWWLALGAVFLLLMYVFMVFRIRILLEEMGVRLGWMDIMKAHVAGMLVADFTPARSGYVATALVMHKKYGVPSEKAMVSILGPQMFDFVAKLLGGGLAVFYLLDAVLRMENAWVLYAAVAGIAAIIFFMALLLFSRRFLKMFSFADKWPVAGELLAMAHRMQGHSGVIIKKSPQITGLLVLTWSLKALSWWAVARSVGIVVDFPVSDALFYLLFQPLVTMLEFIPTPTLAGMGLSEAGGAVVLGMMGVPVAQATAFMLVARFKTIAVNIPGYRHAMEAIGSLGRKTKGARYRYTKRK